MRLTLFFIFILLCSGLGYLLPSTLAAPLPPRIEAFRASSMSLRSGEAVRLNWRLAGGESDAVRLVSAGGIRTPAGNSLRLEPKLTDSYTLVAENRQGSDQQTLEVAVMARPSTPLTRQPSGGAVSGGEAVPTPPDGTFGVSRSPDGPFMNDAASGIDAPSDERIARVAPGSVFFAEVRFEDPDGIAQIIVNLANGSPLGLEGALTPERGPFTLVGAPTGDCNLTALPTRVRCLYRIRVAEDAQNIDALPGAGGEFAYVLRVRVGDGQGASVNKPIRGYVVVTPQTKP